MAVALRVLAPLALATSLAALAACDNGPSAVSTRHEQASASSGSSDDGDEAPARSSHRRASAEDEADVPKVDGKPMWSSNKDHTAQENAQRAFERNGEAFGAHDKDDFIKKVHAFVDDPPPGTATMTRANGDTLLYDAKSNTFAVVTKLGAPRTMFKPDNGKSYWDEQQARERERKNAQRDRPKKDDEDRG